MQEQIISEPPLQARVVYIGTNAQGDLVSEVTMNASLLLHGTMLECAGITIVTSVLAVACKFIGTMVC